MRKAGIHKRGRGEWNLWVGGWQRLKEWCHLMWPPWVEDGWENKCLQIAKAWKPLCWVRNKANHVFLHKHFTSSHIYNKEQFNFQKMTYSGKLERVNLEVYVMGNELCEHTCTAEGNFIKKKNYEWLSNISMGWNIFIWSVSFQLEFRSYLITMLQLLTLWPSSPSQGWWASNFLGQYNPWTWQFVQESKGNEWKLKKLCPHH